MQNVPKIVQARLQRPKPGAAEVHPDADLLTAFAERSLGESERERVVEHLARCGDCREVVALALPATEAVAMPSSSHAAGRAWLSWPALRWGAVAAGILLVSSIGILQYRQRTRQNAKVVSSPGQLEEKIVTVLPSPQPSGNAPAARAIGPQAETKQDQAHSLSRGQGANAAGQSFSSPKGLFPPPQTMNRAGAGGGMGSGFGGGMGSASGQAARNHQVQLQSDASAFAPAAREAAPAASQDATEKPAPATAAQQVEVTGASPVVEVQAESLPLAGQDQVQDKQHLAQNQTEVPAQKQALNNLDVVRSKDSVPPQTESSAVFAPTVNSSKAALQKGMLASPRWAISSTGGLQRSFDAGQTWEEVNVTGVALDGRLKSDSAVAYGANVQDEKIKRSKKAESKAGLVFRALAAMGAEVWVGGSQAMLYYSLDSGAHWTRVLPLDASTLLTGDVVGVELSDAEHARVSTSTGETWITADQGQTWHRQQ